MYQFSSSSANNGSAFDGLGTTGGLISNPSPSPTFVPWDIATALVMIFSRYLPIVAPIAIQWKNSVMFVVEIGAFLTLFYLIQAALGKSESQVSIGYFIALDIWLFLTVLFANFATSLAEERGKAQADSLRKTRRDTIAYLGPNLVADLNEKIPFLTPRCPGRVRKGIVCRTLSSGRWSASVRF